eukprot:1120976-Pelagomonas_calceolata.AAC.1
MAPPILLSIFEVVIPHLTTVTALALLSSICQMPRLSIGECEHQHQRTLCRALLRYMNHLHSLEVFCRGRLCLNPMLAENMQPRHVLLLQSEISSCYSCWGYANGEQPLVHRNDI